MKLVLESPSSSSGKARGEFGELGGNQCVPVLLIDFTI